MTKIKTNEREFQGYVLKWINDIIKSGSYEVKEASIETGVKDVTTKFPDIILWKSREAQNAIATIELKNTLTQIDDRELLENGSKKGANLKCKYLITWNVRESALWNISKGHADLIHKYPAIIAIRTIQDILRPDAQGALRARAREIIEDLDIHITTGVFRAIPLDENLFAGVLHETVEHLNPEMQKALISKYKTDRNFQKELQKWARIQGIRKYDNEEFFTSISKQIVYRIIGQVLFFFALKRHNRTLPDLELSDFDIKKAQDVLQNAFEKVRKIDYQAIYEKNLIDEIDWNTDAAITLQNLLKNLAYYDFSNMPLDVIGGVFEGLIPPNEQHALGQYFTPVRLVDLINGFVVRSGNDEVFDPTCGTGTFLVRAYNRYRELTRTKTHEEIIQKIWGNDIAPFPAELSNINLFIRNLDDANNFPRVLPKDFFDISPGDKIEFPHPRMGTQDGYKMNVPIPQFDGMMGNFPYIRQELIEKTNKGYKQKLVTIIAKEWLAEYPDIFEIPKWAKADYDRWIKGGAKPETVGELFESVELKLSGQADIYAYMFFHAATFLKPGGRMAFLTSNSWLDVAYGYELQKFFTRKFKIIAIIESRCEPWFQNAAVNTAITVLERCDDEKALKNHKARFVKIKKKLAELLPQKDLILQAQQRHLNVDKLVNIIEDDDLIGKEISREIHSFENDNFRIRTIAQSELVQQLEESKETVKWGKFLRAPDVYFQLMDAIGDKLVPLSQVADVRRGYTTGINEFFYLTPDRAELYGIEEEYLVPVVKSPKEIDGLVVDPDKLKFRLFMCNKSKDELRAMRHFGALKYIEEVGEKGATKDGVPWPKVPSVKGKKYWWNLPDIRANVLWVVAYADRLFTAYIENEIHIDKRLFSVKPREIMPISLAAALNSAIVFLELESEIGHTNLGDGALFANVIDLMGYLKVPSIGDIEEINGNFTKLMSRPIVSIFKEIKKKDRRNVDSAILSALGLNPDEWLDRIYDGLTELVRERLELPKMRKTAKKIKKERSITGVVDKLVKTFQNRIRPFPEDFVDLDKVKLDYLSLPPHRFVRCVENGFFSFCEAEVNGKMMKFEYRSPDEALYAFYAQRPGILVLKAPADVPLLVNAVNEYTKWLAKFYEAIFHEAVSRVISPGESENITREVMRKLGLRYP
ncbi:N-6 DNA methylase [bacterium]|nr:N-6 DNA methylase [bacterium]